MTVDLSKKNPSGAFYGKMSHLTEQASKQALLQHSARSGAFVCWYRAGLYIFFSMPPACLFFPTPSDPVTSFLQSLPPGDPLRMYVHQVDMFRKHACSAMRALTRQPLHGECHHVFFHFITETHYKGIIVSSDEKIVSELV